MKREMLPIVHMARRGDPDAMLEVGRGYLLGHAPLPLHPETGIRYLTRAAEAGCVDALCTLADTLTLEQIVRYALLPQLRQAAAHGVHAAELKLGLWLITERAERAAGVYWLRRAATELSEARVALANVLVDETSPIAGSQGLRLLRAEAIAGNVGAWIPLARAALDRHDLPLFIHALERACRNPAYSAADLYALLIEALMLEQSGRIGRQQWPATLLRAALYSKADEGDARAMALLGKALCGLDEDLRQRTGISSNRKVGTALNLLRNAADAGQTEAWIALAELYRQRPRLPFAVATHRYCLERAAATGSIVAAVALGRLLLDGTRTEQDLQRSMELLSSAAQRGDAGARDILAAMVSPVAGDQQAAASALALVERNNPLLATRLTLSRTFGLTQHEALTIDVRRAGRAWGLWVDPSPFFTQRKKATARAVPIASPEAALALQRARSAFANVNASAVGPEGSYRARVYLLRSLFERFRLDGSLFFADAPYLSGVVARKTGRQARALSSAVAGAPVLQRPGRIGQHVASPP